MNEARKNRRGDWVALAIIFIFGISSGPALSQNLQDRNATPLPYEFQVIDVELLDAEPNAAAGTQLLEFEAWGERHQLELRPQALFAAGARIVWDLGRGLRYEVSPEPAYWGGSVRGNPDSKVRLTLSDGAVEGVVVTGEEVYFLEPAAKYWPGTVSREAVIHRLSDQEFSEEAFQCASHSEGRIFGNPDLDLEPSAALLWDEATPSLGKGPLREVELSVVVDSYYFRRHGKAAAGRVHTLIHEANAIAEKEFGVTFRIAATRISTSPSADGVSSATDPVQLLNEFGASHPLAGADLAHLFTARDLNGQTLGAAWMGTACDERYGVGLSQDLNTSKARLVATIHELAHGLGARHDGKGYCAAVGRGWIMWPYLDINASSFSSCSAKLVDLNLPRFECVSALRPEPLPAPEIVAPRGAAHRPVLFEWRSVTGAEAYEIEIYDDAAERVVFQAAVGDTVLQPDFPFQQGQRYRWRVGALKGGETGERTPWEPFALGSWRRLPR